MSLAVSGTVAGHRPVPPVTPSHRHHDFLAMPPAARAFTVAVIASGVLALMSVTPAQVIPEPRVFVALLASAALASLFKVDLPLAHHGTTMSLSFAFEFAALLTLGPQATMVIAALAAWVQCAVRVEARNPIHRTVFSMAALVITARAAGMVYTSLEGRLLNDADGFLGVETAVFAAATTYFVVNALLVSTLVSLAGRQSLPRVWNQIFVWSALSFFVGAGAAAVGVFLVPGPVAWLAPLLLVPQYLTFQTYRIYLERMEAQQRRVLQLSDQHLATLEALAMAIEAKDHTSSSHIRRVQLYATELARLLGIPEEQRQGVRTAALLHDIGKLAVPEHILSKPGPLTQEEFHKVRAHPRVGAEIIAHVPFPYPVASLIRSHHERWDGMGYPDGLKGEQIPLGARILAVVDHFDGLVSDRPYRTALGVEDALLDLQREAGKAFDPRVVACFVMRYPELDREADRLGEPTGSPVLAAGASGGADGEDTADLPASVFEDIALAHREIYALYEIAQSMGTSLGIADTMALISSKLSNLVPFSTCALFLRDEASDRLQCRFATGVDAEAMHQVALQPGQGLVGWVAKNLKTLVNARPGADFEAAGLDVPTALESALVCPLVFNDDLIGVLAVYHERPGCYTDDHRRLLDRIAEQAAAVVSNSVVFEQTKRDSLTDPLTGLPNTRFMFVHLTRELARAERLGAEVSLLVLDLDGFKEINDVYGHHIGDKALREVARVLRQGIRPYDICVRYAGDEFVVVLSGCGAIEAEQKTRELQKAIEEIPFEVRPGRLVQLGSSFGHAVFPIDGESYETLLATADKRMYQDKARRKQLMTADPLPPERPRSVFAKIPAQPSVNRTH